MKHGLPRHPKLKRLARRLGVPRPHAIGILEMLWEFTGCHAPTGDLKRFNAEDIADAVDWNPDDAATLVTELLACGWLDEPLQVHDWQDHCPQWVVRKAQRVASQQLANGYPMASHELANGKQRARARDKTKTKTKTKSPPIGPPQGARQRRKPKSVQLTTARIEAAAAAGLDAERARAEWLKFSDYEFAAPKSDWDACWRNWCRKAAEMAGKRKSDKPADSSESYDWSQVEEL